MFRCAIGKTHERHGSPATSAHCHMNDMAIPQWYWCAFSLLLLPALESELMGIILMETVFHYTTCVASYYYFLFSSYHDVSPLSLHHNFSIHPLNSSTMEHLSTLIHRNSSAFDLGNVNDVQDLAVEGLGSRMFLRQ